MKNLKTREELNEGFLTGTDPSDDYPQSRPGDKWKDVDDELPDNVVKKIQDNNGLRYQGTNIVDAYSNGEKWLVVTDDGAFYKHGAEYMVWYIDPKVNDQGVQSQAIWSDKALANTLKSYKETGKRTNDPDYES